MQVAKRVMLIASGPLVLAAALGGAVAYASQSGGSESKPMSRTYQRVSFGNQAPGGGGAQGDGGCDHAPGGAPAEGAVSPSSY